MSNKISIQIGDAPMFVMDDICSDELLSLVKNNLNEIRQTNVVLPLEVKMKMLEFVTTVSGLKQVNNKEIPTHLEKFIALYKEFGVKLKPFPNEKGILITMCENGRESTKNSKFIGYARFYSEVQFDKDGSFVEQGFWE